MNLRPWFAHPCMESGAQHLVTSNDLGEGSLESSGVERTAQMESSRLIVGGARRLKLSEKPEGGLSVGK